MINRRRGVEKDKQYAEIISTFQATSHIIHHNCDELRFCVNEQVKLNARDGKKDGIHLQSFGVSCVPII